MEDSDFAIWRATEKTAELLNSVCLMLFAILVTLVVIAWRVW